MSAILLVLPAFDLQDGHVAGGEADEEVRAGLVDDAGMDVEDLEAQVVVLHPGIDQGVVIEDEGFGRLPGAVVDAEEVGGGVGIRLRAPERDRGRSVRAALDLLPRGRGGFADPREGVAHRADDGEVEVGAGLRVGR